MNKAKKELALQILKIFAVGIGITTVSILSPQLPYLLLRAYIKKKLNNSYSEKQINNSLKYLKRKKFISYQFKENKIKVIISKFGKRHLKKTSIRQIQIPPVKWDGRWRLLTFDIPEDQPGIRQTFRNKLKELGFFHFQRSVFIIPYPCEDEIDQLAKLLNIRPYVHILTCNRFISDNRIRKKFGLSDR